MYGVNAQQKSCIFTAEKSAACGPTLTQAAPIKNKLFFSPPDMAPLHDLCAMIYLLLIQVIPNSGGKNDTPFLTPDKAVECAHAAQDALHSL